MLIFNLCIGVIIYSFSIKKVIEPLKEISEISGRVSEGDFSKRISKKYTFESKSDTEVVLKAYIEWGLSCFSYFEGMFSICIIDEKIIIIGGIAANIKTALITWVKFKAK